MGVPRSGTAGSPTGPSGFTILPASCRACLGTRKPYKGVLSIPAVLDISLVLRDNIRYIKS